MLLTVPWGRGTWASSWKKTGGHLRTSDPASTTHPGHPTPEWKPAWLRTSAPPPRPPPLPHARHTGKDICQFKKEQQLVYEPKTATKQLLIKGGERRARMGDHWPSCPDPRGPHLAGLAPSPRPHQASTPSLHLPSPQSEAVSPLPNTPCARRARPGLTRTFRKPFRTRTYSSSLSAT